MTRKHYFFNICVFYSAKLESIDIEGLIYLVLSWTELKIFFNQNHMFRFETWTGGRDGSIYGFYHYVTNILHPVFRNYQRS